MLGLTGLVAGVVNVVACRLQMRRGASRLEQAASLAGAAVAAGLATNCVVAAEMGALERWSAVGDQGCLDAAIEPHKGAGRSLMVRGSSMTVAVGVATTGMVVVTGS